MIWHSAGSFVLQIGTPFAAVRVLAWLVALFGSEPFSRRAMLLLRRRPLSRELSAQAPEQALAPGSDERCPPRAGVLAQIASLQSETARGAVTAGQPGADELARPRPGHRPDRTTPAERNSVVSAVKPW